MTGDREPLAGRYELHEVLGRGGMGVVYAGIDRILQRPVAVKVLPDQRADDPTVVTRFEREAQAAAALNHPNIVAVYDTGRDETTRFIVMELVDGENLAELLSRRGPLPVEEAVAIARQVAAALKAPHAAGIVHRDIKPANVMVDAAGQVKVLDFGIARTPGSADLTRTAYVLGSAAYLAPEVIRGDRADKRADIYALGCVLYELLTGDPPFTGDVAAAVLHQHSTRRPRPLRRLRPEVSAPLAALVTEMLAKDPTQRPSDAGALAVALAKAGAPAASGATAPLGVLSRRSRLERIGLGAAAMLVVAGLALAATSAGSGGSAESGGTSGGAPAALLSTRTAAFRVEQGVMQTFTALQSSAAKLVPVAPVSLAPPQDQKPPKAHGDAGPKGHGHDSGPGGGPPGHDKKGKGGG